MGQYYVVINLDKQEFLKTYKFNDGAKLLEFGCSADGTMTALAVLLSDGNGRGGGDLHSEDPIIGSWSGDRIVIAGDYADEGKFLKKEQILKYLMLNDEDQDIPNLFTYAHKYFKDISEKVLTAMLDDQYILETYKKVDLYGAGKETFQKVMKKKEKKEKMAKAG